MTEEQFKEAVTLKAQIEEISSLIAELRIEQKFQEETTNEIIGLLINLRTSKEVKLIEL